MARKTYRLSIVTPERTVYEGEVNSATLPAEGGYLGVWANHAPLVAAVRPGVLTLHEGTSEQETAHYAVGGGFAEVSEGKMILVVDTCELETDIDAKRAEVSLERAKELLKQALRGDASIDVEAAKAMKERAEARLHVAYMRGN